MKKFLMLLLLVTLIACNKDVDEGLFDDVEKDGLVVQIEGMRNDDGQIIFNVMDVEENPVDTVYQSISDNTCEIIITDLPPGRYAFQYIHDENTNFELDANAIGIPTEGYGYSRNASGAFGPPDMDDMAFDFDGKLEMHCKILYLF